MKKIVKDERMVAQSRQINSEGCIILLYGLLVSIIIQIYIMHAQFIQIAGEFIILMAGSIYIVVRSLFMGTDLFSGRKSSQRLIFFQAFVCAVAVSAIQAVSQWAFMQQAPHDILISLGIGFVCAFLSSLAAFELLYFFNKKRQQQLDAKLEQEQDDND